MRGRSRRAACVVVVWFVGSTRASSFLVGLLVVVLVLLVSTVVMSGGGLVGALPGPSAHFLLHGGLALGAVPPAILLVPVRQRLAAKGQVVILDRYDGHPGRLCCLGVVVGGGRGVGVVPGRLL